MKWTVQRYVLREVVQTWLAVTGVLVAILVSNQLSRVLGRAASNQYGRHLVFDLIALGSVMNLSVIVPVGLLLAVVLSLGRMYHDSEMAALQACGFGPQRLLAPLLCFAAVIALGLGWLSFFQVPLADIVVDYAERAGITVVEHDSLSTVPGAVFTGEVEKIVEHHAQAVFLAGEEGEGTAELWRDLYKAAPNMLLLGSSSMAGEAFTSQIDAAAAEKLQRPVRFDDDICLVEA